MELDIVCLYWHWKIILLLVIADFLLLLLNSCLAFI